MTESASISIQGLLDDTYMQTPARPPPPLTLNFGELRERFSRLVAVIGSMSSGYQEHSQHIDELHYQRTLDSLTDQLHEVCMDLGTLRATCSDHLKLKISALLYLLPEEADTELRLAKSLLADLEANAPVRAAVPA